MPRKVGISIYMNVYCRAYVVLRVFGISCLTHFVEPEMFVLPTIPLAHTHTHTQP